MAVVITDALLREFLLGKLDDAEREAVESRFLTDPHTKEQLLIAEQDLIEDYLENNLTTGELERFLAVYAQTEEQRQKLEITKSIKDFALKTPAYSERPAPAVSFWNRLTRALSRPVFVIPITVTIVAVIVLAIVWTNARMSQRKHFEEELAQLNSPASLRETQPRMRSIELRPVTLRGVESRTELSLGEGARIFEFRLPWIQQEHYPVYRARVRHVGDDESFTIANLQADAGGEIRVRLMSEILRRGLYVIEISGITSGGSVASTEEYSFSVTP